MKNFYSAIFLNKVWIVALVVAMAACSQLEVSDPDKATLEQSAEEMAAAFSLDPYGLENARTSSSGIVPVVYNSGPGGNVECSEVGDYEFSSGRINYSSGAFSAAFPAGFTVITNGTTVTWSYDSSVTGLCLTGLSIIVKGGPNANVYTYTSEDNLSGDFGLTAPINPNNGRPYGLSNLTFCYDAEPCDDEVCYGEDTAWSAGTRYQDPGNWATYTSYLSVEKTVTLFAGQTINIGTVTFTPEAGQVRITINLTAAKFQNVSENVKIQGYTEAPSGNPNPGGFTTHKATVSPDDNSYSVLVPAFAYYGVHVDSAPIVPCD
jgi:hypothetical protein